MTMADKKSGKDLFQYLELYDETAEDYDKFAPLSMGAPGKETLLGCSDLMTRAAKSVLVSFVCHCFGLNSRPTYHGLVVDMNPDLTLIQ